ncbi:MAG: FAD-binding oxidoreductase [Deltaproteobacteria bacterium]|nr:FAD-binding oxidoreductase [Deltaproteobacteria bacterium]
MEDILFRQLASIFPEDRISNSEAVLMGYAMDSATPPGASGFPSVVVLPETANEVKALLQVANRLKVPVTTMARGSNIAGMATPMQGGIVVDLRHMNRILEINTEAAYAVIEPGVTFHELSQALKEKGFICHLPTASGGGSPMANYLMRPSGNLTAKWDPDPILSLEVVLPSGEIIETGSATFKTAGWRSRYAPFSDLTGLFACSYGTLGIVTKAAVKIFDRGEEERLLLTVFDDFAPALEYMKLIIRRNLADSTTFWTWGWNMFHDMVLSKSKTMPSEMLKEDQRTPPPGIPFGISSTRLSGYGKVVDAQQEMCVQVAKDLGGDFLDPEEAREKHPGSWKFLSAYFADGVHIKPGEESQLRAGLHLPGCLVTAEPSQILNIERYMWDLARKEFDPPYFFRCLPYAHAREFFFAFVVYVTGSLIEKKAYMQHIKSIYGRLYDELLTKFGAVMFRFRKDPTFLARTGEYGYLLRRIKAMIDPHNIMNPSILLF